MSHSGTLVVLANRRRACSLPALPAITMLDGQGRPLAIARQAPVGMHPGPVMVPVRVAARGVVSTPIRWVSGEVFDHSRCFAPVRIAVAIGGRRLTAPITAHVCGEAGAPATFTQPPLRPGTATSE